MSLASGSGKSIVGQFDGLVPEQPDKIWDIKGGAPELAGYLDGGLNARDLGYAPEVTGQGLDEFTFVFYLPVTHN
jgi:hypothetical protein